MPLDCGRRGGGGGIQIKQELVDDEDLPQQNSDGSRNLGLEPKYSQSSGLDAVHGGDTNNNNTSSRGSSLYSPSNCSLITNLGPHTAPSNHLAGGSGGGGGLNNRQNFILNTKRAKLSPMNWNHVPSVRHSQKMQIMYV